MKRGGPLARKTGLTRRTRLAPRSRKRIDQDAEYRKVVDYVRRRDRNTCQVAIARGGIQPRLCWGPLDPHHIRPTGQGGPRLEAWNIMLACRACHSWLHDNPASAKLIGVLR